MCVLAQNAVFRRVYIYHSVSDSRAVVGVFWEASNSNAKSGSNPSFEAQIYLVQPRGQLQPINPKRLFAQAVEGLVRSNSLDLNSLRRVPQGVVSEADLDDNDSITIPGFSARIAQVSSMTKAYDGLRNRYV